MTLLEVMLASVLFFASSTASLLTWSRAVAVLEADGRRAERLEGLEAELQAAEMRLRDPALQASPAVPCAAVRQALVQALEREPAAAGVVRQIATGEGGQPLRLQLAASELRREREYDPAAFGGCTHGSSPADSPAGTPTASAAAPFTASAPSAAASASSTAASSATESHAAL